MWYSFLNIFFLVFHSSLTLFNCIGWLFRSTRKSHLITVMATAFSWFFLGIWYGWGYCLCTDWHWAVREKMGLHDRSHSYIHFLIYEITGADLYPAWVDRATLIVFLTSALLSIILNGRDHKQKITAVGRKRKTSSASS